MERSIGSPTWTCPTQPPSWTTSADGSHFLSPDAGCDRSGGGGVALPVRHFRRAAAHGPRRTRRLAALRAALAPGARRTADGRGGRGGAHLAGAAARVPEDVPVRDRPLGPDRRPAPGPRRGSAAQAGTRRRARGRPSAAAAAVARGWRPYAHRGATGVGPHGGVRARAAEDDRRALESRARTGARRAAHRESAISAAAGGRAGRGQCGRVGAAAAGEEAGAPATAEVCTGRAETERDQGAA